MWVSDSRRSEETIVDAIFLTCYSYRKGFVNHSTYNVNFSVFYQNETHTYYVKQWLSPPSIISLNFFEV
jgi:hypothetical protein